jgi:hypothetical protein
VKNTKQPKKQRMSISRFEAETLREICKNNDCGMDTLIDALMNNVVSQEISIQIEYLKTGKLPK